jgi:hypothetical protein
MMDVILKNASNASQGGGTTVHEGNVVINMDGQELEISEVGQARIRSIVREEVASARPTSYTEYSSAVGGMRR